MLIPVQKANNGLGTRHTDDMSIKKGTWSMLVLVVCLVMFQYLQLQIYLLNNMIERSIISDLDCFYMVSSFRYFSRTTSIFVLIMVLFLRKFIFRTCRITQLQHIICIRFVETLCKYGNDEKKLNDVIPMKQVSLFNLHFTNSVSTGHSGNGILTLYMISSASERHLTRAIRNLCLSV